MRLSEIPKGCVAVRCQACDEFLAIPAQLSPREFEDAHQEASADHVTLCPARARHPSQRPDEDGPL